MSFSAASFGEALTLGQVFGPYSFVPAVAVDPTNGIGCKAFPEGAFAGKMALIQRGSCEFGVKVLNAEKAGATFAVIYNNTAGGDGLINMGPGAVGGQVTIPSIFIGLTNGTAMVNWYTANGAAAQAALSTVAYQSGNTPDIIASFSSRGPGVGNVLKPDITAPGVNILAQGFDPTVTGEAGNFGYGQASGTSMAAPHVAGAAALLKQIHPDWSPAWIKSALMSTSKYMDIFTDAGRRPGPAAGHGCGPPGSDERGRSGRDPRSAQPQLRRGDLRRDQDHRGQADQRRQRGRNLRDQHGQYRDGFWLVDHGGRHDGRSAVRDPGPRRDQDRSRSPGTPRSRRRQGDNQGFVLMKGAVHQAHMPAWMRVAYAPMPILLEANMPFPAGVDVTLAAIGMAPALEPLVLVDNNSAPAAGMARVRFVHASPDAPAVDIALKDGPVLLPNIAYKGHADGEVPAGTYDLEVRAGRDNDRGSRPPRHQDRRRQDLHGLR